MGKQLPLVIQHVSQAGNGKKALESKDLTLIPSSTRQPRGLRQVLSLTSLGFHIRKMWVALKTSSQAMVTVSIEEKLPCPGILSKLK